MTDSTTIVCADMSGFSGKVSAVEWLPPIVKITVDGEVKEVSDKDTAVILREGFVQKIDAPGVLIDDKIIEVVKYEDTIQRVVLQFPG